MKLEFSKFVSQILVPSWFSAEESDFLKQLRSKGSTYADFAHVVESNKAMSTRLMESINAALKEKIKQPITHSSVALSTMGYLPARNFLAASVLLGHPPELLPGSPKIVEATRFSVTAETSGDSDNPFAGDQYQAGLIYDLLHMLSGSKKNIESYAKDIWTHSAEVYKKAVGLGRALSPGLGLDHELCLDGLLHDVGKIILAILSDGQSVTWVKSNPKHSLDLSWKLEIGEFGFSHELLGYLLLSQIGFTKDHSYAALYHHRPYQAKRLGTRLHHRVYLIWLANQIMRHSEYHKRSQPSERKVNNWYMAILPVFPKLKKSEFTKILSDLK